MNTEKETQKIYFILSYTGTMLSRLIKLYTRAEFSHVSISLDEKLNQMYSFGRLRPYNPFIGGFVHENINWGTFKRFKKAKIAIYSLDITKEQYNKIYEIIGKMKDHKKEYRFNVKGLFLSAFNKKITRNKYFYCAEFIKYLMEEAKIELNLPEFIKPMDFDDLSLTNLTYKGKLYNYCN